MLIECFAWLIPWRKSWFSQQESFAFIPAVASQKPGACAKSLGFPAIKSSFLSKRKEPSCYLQHSWDYHCISFASLKEFMDLVNAKICSCQNYEYILEVSFYVTHIHGQEDPMPIYMFKIHLL